MRLTLCLLMTTTAVPLAAQNQDPLAFLRSRDNEPDVTFIQYREQPYQPVRSGEVRSAGFLTEHVAMPFGRVLGPVHPPVVHSTSSGEAPTVGTLIGVQPPSGAAYQRGDTIVLARRIAGPEGWGDIVIPTGLARVGDRDPRQTLARVIAMYGEIRTDQLTYPIEPLNNPGRVQPAPVSGPSGKIISGRDIRELEQAGSFMFIDQGRSNGIRIGDFIQVRHRPMARPNAADTIDDLMAVGEVVHVGEHSSTIKLIQVIDPVIRPGTPVVRVATLPN